MKTIINGKVVECTPQELIEYERLKYREASKKPMGEMCREIGQSLGALMALNYHLKAMNQNLKQEMAQKIKRRGESIGLANHMSPK